MKALSAFAMVVPLLLTPAVTTAQPMGGPMNGRGMMGGGMMGGPSSRHLYVRQHGLPEAYRSLSNPIQNNQANIKAGKQQYEVSCAVCHGSNARGDGPAASQLNPAPTDLQLAVHTPIASDGFLHWSIAEGGSPIGSAMPAFKSSLKPKDIWRIILYLRQQ